jgi:putative ABC transport system permease protein
MMDMLDRLFQDLRYAFRQLRSNPGFTVVTILVLALGIGANAAVFSVINAVLLRPLPFPDSGQLVQIWESNSSRGEIQETVSPWNFVDWQKQSTTLAQMAVHEYESLALATSGAPQRMDAALVSSGFFQVFQVAPQLGRTFLPEDDHPGSHSVVLSHKGWTSYFNSDPHIVGKAITLDGEPFTVIGVMPATFRFPALGTDLWATPAFDLKSRSRGTHYLFAVGRMRPGVALGQAQAEMSAIAHRLERQYPDTNQGTGVKLVPLQEEMVGSFRRGLLLLWGAVTLVLLIACANVAHLLLARSTARQKEFAIRTALGAGSPRLIQQLLTESGILGATGGLLGLALSPLAIHLLTAAGGHGHIVPRTEGIRIDENVIAFTVVASLLTAVLFGLLPAFRSSRVDVVRAMKQSGWETSLGGSYRLRSVLVVSELALSVMLLIGAGLLIKSLWQLERVDPGFSPANVLGMRVSVPKSQYPGSRERAVLYQQMVDRIRAVPGVEDAAAINDLPFSGSRTTTSFDIDGLPAAPGESRDSDRRVVTSGYFNVMRIHLLKGRSFTDADNRRESPRVAIINEALLRLYWRNANPLGQRVVIDGQHYEIVGVVGNVKHDNLAAAGTGEIYVPQYQGGTPPWTFLAIRSHAGLGSLIPGVRNALREVAPGEPVYDTRNMEQRLAGSIAPQQFNAIALAVFASFALVLAAIGIYGVVAFATERRAHEMGIRMAVGAQPGDVLRLVVGQGLRLGFVGVVIGVAGALAISRIIAGMLYDTGTGDPITYLAVSVIFLGIAIVASYLPARRAARLDPMAALRWE